MHRKKYLIILCLVFRVGAVFAQNETALKQTWRTNRFYVMLPFHTGFSSYQLNPVSSSVSFPYSYVNSGAQNIYNGALVSSGFKALAPLWGLALELGFSKSFAINYQFSEITTISPVASSFTSDFTLIYNVRLTRCLTLQPAFGIGVVDTDISYPQSIDNSNKDVLVLGTIYPYTSTQSTRYGTTQILNNQVNVAIEDQKEGLIYRLGVCYRALPIVAIGSSINFFSRVNDVTLLDISNKSKSDDFTIPDSRITFKSDPTGNSLFHAAPLSIRFYVALYFGGR